MTTYAFRLTCKLAKQDFVIKEDTPLALPPPAPPIQVMLGKARPWTGGQPLILQGGGFASEEEARAAGIPVKTAVMLAGLLLGVGIDVGTDQVISSAPRDKDGQSPEYWQPDVHGLQVVPELDKLSFGFAYISGTLIRKTPLSTADLEDRITQSYTSHKTLTKKQALAAQLYSQSHFQSPDAARFLTLISAIEALAERQRRASATVALVKHMIAQARTADDLEEYDRQSLIDGIGNLKQESISSACRRLVRTYCGDPVVQHFTRVYKIRGELLHNGEPPPETNFAVECSDLDMLVRSLAVNHIARSWRS